MWRIGYKPESYLKPIHIRSVSDIDTYSTVYEKYRTNIDNYTRIVRTAQKR
jgi:hypothetical protein